MQSMRTLLLFLVLVSGYANAQVIRDEALSQKYENLLLDGEDKEVVEDMMTQEGVTAEDLELEDQMSSSEDN